MSDQDTIFEETSTTEDNSATTTTTTESDNFMEMYVGEGKKYADVGEAIKALHHSQEHIQTLETENRDLRTQAEKAKTTEEILEALRTKQEEGADNSHTTSIDEKALEEMLDRKLTDREQAAVATNNIKLVDTKMKSMFGDKAKSQLRAKATELGVSLDSMMRTASESPDAFMRWFDGGVSQNATSLNSDVNTEKFEQDVGSQQVKQGTYKYYEKMRKEHPSKYFSPAIQLEMNNNAANMGDKFYA